MLAVGEILLGFAVTSTLLIAARQLLLKDSLL